MATANQSFTSASGASGSGAPSIEDRGRQQQAQAFLLRLTRAVQRAAIYPPGHPAVSQGVGPLVEALQDLLGLGPVTVAVGRTRLLVSGGHSAPTEHELPWLANRLFDRQVSAFTVAPELDAGELARFVSWMSAADEGAELPEFGGLALSRFDGKHLRFREGEAAAEGLSASTAWHALTAPLRQAYGTDDAGAGATEPRELAARIREAVHHAEGTGVSALTTALERLHESARGLDSDERAAVTARLASLVNDLEPELRGSLLATTGADSSGKLALLEALLPHLSRAVVADIAGSITIGATPVPPAFARFLDKLSRAAASDPAAREALERRVPSAAVEQVMAAALHAPDGQSKTTSQTDYAARLDQLASARPGARGRAVLVDTAAFEAAAVEAHLARIALRQVEVDPAGADAAVSWACLLERAPGLRDRRSLALLAAIADAVVRLRALGPKRPVDLVDLGGRFERLFAEPASVAVALEAIAAPAGDAGELAPMLLGAGGQAAVRGSLDWFARAPDDASRDRVAVVVAGVDPELFKSAVAPALADNLAAADAIAGVLGRIDPARAIDIALGLTAHPRAEIRRRSIAWLLQAPLGTARLQRVLQRGVDDTDRGVVSLAMDAAVRADGAVAVDPLTSLVARTVAPEIAPEQRRAIRALGGRPDGLARLADLLAHRGYLCGTTDRRTSAAIARVLVQCSSGPARAAAGSWRWSPAGVLSLILDRRGEAAS